MQSLRICIYVQHLLGTGHLVRMKILAATLARAGHRVTLISGGMTAGQDDKSYQLIQLPCIKAKAGDFTTLLDREGKPVSPAFKAHRTGILLDLVAAEPPQVLVVETFPFGRRQLRFELVPLLQRVRKMAPNPLTLCSIRDILQSRKIERYRQTISEVNAWFDHVLVHADPAVVTLKETFPLADELNGKVFYSGYLSAQANSGCEREEQANEEQANEEQDRTNRDGRGEVIVSAGGGAVSLELLQSAIAARQYSKLNNHTWRLLVGRNLVTDQFDELRDHAGDNIIVERNRPDFPRLLSACAVSVSQAGYNTVLDILAAGCRSVLVPYSQNGETEQTFRAKKFSGMGRTILLQEKDLDARQLAAAVDRAARIDLSKCRHINMDGASQAARFIEREYLHRQRVKHAD